MSSSEERSIPAAAPLQSISEFADIGMVENVSDLREVVDHDWDWGGIEDSLEEVDNGSSVTCHSESKVSCAVSHPS